MGEDSRETTSGKIIKIIIIVAMVLFLFGLLIISQILDSETQTTKIRNVFTDFDQDGDVDFIKEADILINDGSPFIIAPYQYENEIKPTDVSQIPLPTSTMVPTAGIGGVVIDRDGDFSLSQGWPYQITQWETHISDAAREFYIDPNLIAAIIMKESQGQASITGKDGEQGLMQVMPRFHSCATYEPRANIFCGTSILASNIQYYAGDIRTALAAYNAGRDNISAGAVYANVVLGNMDHYVVK